MCLLYCRTEVILEQGGQEAHHLMDARRISDGQIVMLKRVNARKKMKEVEMARRLLTEPYLSDPCNHCIPIYDILTLPEEDGTVLLVMPFVYPWELQPKLKTIGETVEFLRQIFEVGLTSSRCIVSPNFSRDIF